MRGSSEPSRGTGLYCSTRLIALLARGCRRAHRGGVQGLSQGDRL